jgi:hypothetical protein
MNSWEFRIDGHLTVFAGNFLLLWLPTITSYGHFFSTNVAQVYFYCAVRHLKSFPLHNSDNQFTQRKCSANLYDSKVAFDTYNILMKDAGNELDRFDLR